MLINDINKPALIVWGTKRGKSVFFSSNLLETNEELNNQLKDIQLNISFQRIDHDFYSFDFTKESKFINIIRSLNDALGRVGYLAISLVIDASKTFGNEDDLVGILKRLLDEYVQKYVISDYTRKTINASIREDVPAFEVILRDSNLKLENEQGLMPGQQLKETKGVLFLKFEDEVKLREIIKHFDREELRGYERVLVLPEGQNDLTANIAFTILAPVKKKIHYKFKFCDEQDNLLYDVSCFIKSDKRGLNTFTCDVECNEICEEGEQINLKVVKKGYKSREVSTYEIMSNAISYGSFSVLKVRLAEEAPVIGTTQTGLKQQVGGKISNNAVNKLPTHQVPKGPSIKKFAIALAVLLVVILGLMWLVKKSSEKQLEGEKMNENEITTQTNNNVLFDTASWLNNLKGKITAEYQAYKQSKDSKKMFDSLSSYKSSAAPFKGHKNYNEVVNLIEKYENEVSTTIAPTKVVTDPPINTDPETDPDNIGTFNNDINWNTGPYTESEFKRRYQLLLNKKMKLTEFKSWFIKHQSKFSDLEAIKKNNSNLMLSWGLKPNSEKNDGNGGDKKASVLKYSPADLEKMLKEDKDQAVLKWWKENCINMKPEQRRMYTEKIKALKKAGCN